MREAADRSDRKVSALATEISLDRRVFDALRAMDLTGADPVTRYYVSRILRDFRLAGVDQDCRHPRADQGAARRAGGDRPGVRPQHPRRRPHDRGRIRGELAGLPEDYIAAHPPGRRRA